MVCINTTKLIVAFFLTIGGSAAEKVSRKMDVPEDELFWSRQLQESMSVPVKKCILDVSHSFYAP
jgi:transposase-like protein